MYEFCLNVCLCPFQKVDLFMLPKWPCWQFEFNTFKRQWKHAAELHFVLRPHLFIIYLPPLHACGKHSARHRAGMQYAWMKHLQSQQQARLLCVPGLTCWSSELQPWWGAGLWVSPPIHEAYTAEMLKKNQCILEIICMQFNSSIRNAWFSQCQGCVATTLMIQNIPTISSGFLTPCCGPLLPASQETADLPFAVMVCSFLDSLLNGLT